MARRLQSVDDLDARAGMKGQELAAANDVQAAIEAERFEPYHASQLLQMAVSADDHRRAIATIVKLVGQGQRRST
jgi:hypothetical protein